MVNATTTSSILDDIDVQKAMESSYKNGYADGYANALKDKTLYRIIDLLNEANKEIALHRVDGLASDEERTLKVDYVKKHLFEK